MFVKYLCNVKTELKLHISVMPCGRNIKGARNECRIL